MNSYSNIENLRSVEILYNGYLYIHLKYFDYLVRPVSLKQLNINSFLPPNIN